MFDCCNEIRRNPLEDFNLILEGSTNKLNLANLEVYINGQIYQKHLILEEVDVLVRLLRRNWCYLQNTILNNNTVSHNEFTTIREEINKCLKLIIEGLKFCNNNSLKTRYLLSTMKAMKTFSPLLSPISKLEDNIYMKLGSSSQNKDKCPIYQYFHTFLEIQYYLLLLDYFVGNTEELKNHLNLAIQDLVALSLKSFHHKRKTPFLCECDKSLWLIIQLLCERSSEEEIFWPMFNKAVESCEGKFILWLLHEVGNLQAAGPNGNYVGCLSERIKPNYAPLESSLKSVVSQRDNEPIISSLKAIEPLVCSLWLKSAKIEIYQILWDYFSKRLNLPHKYKTDLNMAEIVELIDTVLWTPKDCNEDFELFLSMLSVHLNEYPFHWGKIKGRIYSQLGPNKIKDLNTVGIFHVLLLYVVLTNINFEEQSKKFLMLIENFPADRKRSQLIWSFYNAFIVRHVRENRNIETASAPFIKMLDEASNDHNSFHLIKNFVTDFDNIVKYSVNLQLQQCVLINRWIHKYMTTCYHPDLISLLNVLLNVIEKVNNEQVWCDWEFSFKTYVYQTLKYVASSRSAPDISGTLAAKITVLSPNLLSEAFTFFNSESIVPKVSSNFLCVILENYPNSFILSPQQEIVALQSWTRICLLTRDNYEELTRNIVKLDIIPPFIKTELPTAKDPLCSFIECIAVNIKQHLQSSNMIKFCENCFGQAEKWITQFLAQPDNEAAVLRIYTCIGLAFYKIGPLLYNKHKATCPYTRLVSSVLLSTELMIGKTPNPFVLQGIKKTWHLFFEASIKLNSPGDAYIDRTLRELVVKFIPHFTIVDSPMLKCLDNEVTAEVILEKMSNAFFKQQTKEAESNIFKSLRIVKEFVQSTTSVVLLKLVINKTLYGLFETVMFQSQRNLALDIINKITSSSLYGQVKSDFEESIITITEKHLAFNTTNYFQLLGVLAKFIPLGLKNLIPRIKQQISNVERMRGVGFDKNLRLGIERLEASLMQM